MAWQVVQSIWFVPAAMGALAVLAFLRLLAVDRRNQVHAHETRRAAMQQRCEYERRRLERLLRQQQQQQHDS